MAQEESKYQEMIKAQMIEGHENDNADQDRNNAPKNDEDNEQQARTRTNVVFLVYNSLFLFHHSRKHFTS